MLIDQSTTGYDSEFIIVRVQLKYIYRILTKFEYITSWSTIRMVYHNLTLTRLAYHIRPAGSDPNIRQPSMYINGSIIVGP